MSNGFFIPVGYYETNPDGSFKPQVDSAGAPVDKSATFHPVWTKSYLTWPMDSSVSIIAKNSWFSLATGWDSVSAHVWFIGTKDGSPEYLSEFDVSIPVNTRRFWQPPTGTDQVGIHWLPTTDAPLAWSIEVLGQ